MADDLAPRNPDFERAVRESFAKQTFMTTLGAALERVEPGAVDVAVPFSEALCQQNGYLHAGVLASVADSACGYAALTLAAPGQDVLAVEFKINLMAPASAPRLLARGRVVRAGRRLTVCLSEVLGVNGDEHELVATMLSTISTRPGGA